MSFFSCFIITSWRRAISLILSLCWSVTRFFALELKRNLFVLFYSWENCASNYILPQFIIQLFQIFYVAGGTVPSGWIWRRRHTCSQTVLKPTCPTLLLLFMGALATLIVLVLHLIYGALVETLTSKTRSNWSIDAITCAWIIILIKSR